MTRGYRQLHKFRLSGSDMGHLLSCLWVAGAESFGADPDALALHDELNAVTHSFAVNRKHQGFMLTGTQLGAAIALLAFYRTKEVSKTFAVRAGEVIKQLQNAQIVWVKRGA